jgi:O-antigen/teichoic acid export membrane protein
MLLAHELILVQYPQYADAVLAVYILTPCLFLESFLSSAQIVLQVHERYRLLILPRLLTLVILPLIVWGALNYGLVGAAFAVGGGRVLTALATAVMAQRAFPLRYSWLFFGRITLATLGMTGVVVGLKHVIGLSTVGTGLVERLAGAGVLLMVAAAGAASFVVLLRLMGGLEEDDYRRILESRLPLRHWLVKVL